MVKYDDFWNENKQMNALQQLDTIIKKDFTVNWKGALCRENSH